MLHCLVRSSIAPLMTQSTSTPFTRKGVEAATLMTKKEKYVMLVITQSLSIPLNEIELSAIRAQGPGWTKCQ